MKKHEWDIEKNKIRDLMLIDGAAGHMIPRQTDKLGKLGDIVKHYFDNDKPKAFSVKIPDENERYFQVIHSEEMPRLGFRAIAYQEVKKIDEDGTPEDPILENGRAKLYFDFQGTKNLKDASTLAKIAMKRPVPRKTETEEFVCTAIDKAGGKSAISQIISGGHSHGTTKVLTSYFFAKEQGINNVKLLLTEPAGAASTLDALTEKFATADKSKQEVKDEILANTISIVSGPDHTLISKFAGGAIGKTYQLNTYETAFDEQENVGKFRSKMNRRMDSHAQDRLMKAVLNGAILQEIDPGRGKAPSRRKFLMKAASITLGAAAVADFGLGTLVNKSPAFLTDSYTPPPLPGYIVATPDISKNVDTICDSNAFPSISKLIESPVDPVSLAIQGNLDLADSKQEMDKSSAFKYKENAHSVAYKASGEIRSDLYDLNIFDPAKYDEATYEVEKHKPENYLVFRTIAHHHNPHTGDKAVALLHPETGTLVISTAGFRKEWLNRPFGIFTRDASRTVSPEFAKQFLGELSDQIAANHLQLNKTLITSHSIGVANGMLMQTQIRLSPTLQEKFGGVPHMVALEGFGESLAADAIAKKYSIPKEEIGVDISSVRVARPSTDEGHEYPKFNLAVGHKRYAIPNMGESEDPHRSDILANWLTTGRSVVEATQERFKRPASLRKEKEIESALGEIFKAGREGRDFIGL